MCTRRRERSIETREPGGPSRERLEGLAAGLGLEPEVFRGCLASERGAAAVERDRRAAAAVGVASPPGLLVNGRLLAGAAPYERLAAVIEDELARIEAGAESGR